MTDERYTFVTDVANKKRTARGIYNKRTHCGKGGAVRFPSDSLTRKEKEAMNGEVKAYRLNDPMKLDAFKALPDDLKEVYVKGLRSRFRVPDSEIAEMFGVSRPVVCRCFKSLGLSVGNGCRASGFLKEDWIKWLNGIKTDRVKEDHDVPAPVEEFRGGEDINEPQEKKAEEMTIDRKGRLYRALGRIEGIACGCDEVVKKCLLLSVAQISVAWGLSIEEEGEDNATD